MGKQALFTGLLISVVWMLLAVQTIIYQGRMINNPFSKAKTQRAALQPSADLKPAKVLISYQES